MKTWLVCVPPVAPNWPPVTLTVQADYLLLQNGIAVFKREVTRSYPEIIRVFADGCWRSIRQET